MKDFTASIEVKVKELLRTDMQRIFQRNRTVERRILCFSLEILETTIYLYTEQRGPSC